MASVIRGDDSFDSKDVNIGAAKAWVNFNGTGTVAIRDQFNVSSITDNGTGIYTINFTTNMPDTNFAVTGSAGNDAVSNRIFSIGQEAASVSNHRVRTTNDAGTVEDAARVCVTFFST